jgi:hypothetical protein
MPLTKLAFRPGIQKEVTSYSNEGGWNDCDKVRFRAGFAEKIGGWQKFSTSSYLGTARALHAFVALDKSRYLGVGTNKKYYVHEGGVFYDITPTRLATSAGDATFAASNGSSTITVTENGHGAIAGDFVSFTGAASLGGNITANVLNQEYEIQSVVDQNSYTIIARVAETTIQSLTDDGSINRTPVTANSSDTGNGGGSVAAEYQINTGLDTSVQGNGWGAGTWGRSTWNSNADVVGSNQAFSILRIWTHDNFGEDLIINVRDGDIFYWDASGGTGARAAKLSLRSNADAGTPTVAKKVIVSDVDRHVICFGCDAVGAIGTQDPLLIRFSSQEDPTTWIPSATNTAGDLRIGSGSEIVTAVETRQQILVITDVSVHSMQFLGPPFTFGVQMISENTTIRSPQAAVAVDDTVFWMGLQEFYVYNGSVKKLPCSVKDHVFSDFNTDQAEKVIAGVNSSFGEIWWFYPSANSTENDKYVIYNYEQQIWYIGSLTRTAWLDRGINDFPIAAHSDNYLYNHEFGFDDGSTDSAISAHIESSQMDIQDGDGFLFIRRILPDLTFRTSTGSGSDSPAANFILKARNFPGTNYGDPETSGVTQTSTSPIEQFTDQVHVRLRGRSFALRVESTAVGVGWRLGSPRVDIRPDGRR